MKTYVFNIGFNRSGTTSLSSALNLLNIRTIHCHLENRKTPLEKVIKQNIKNNQKLFFNLDKKYQGFSDFNGQEFYRILYKQYPNSKFILTTRPVLDWLNSYITLMSKIYPERFNNNEAEKKSYESAIHRYFNIGQEIRSFFKNKPDQFLEIKICEGEGWEKLCPFLGVDVPNIPFPWENKTLKIN
jgi:hypothetical protein